MKWLIKKQASLVVMLTVLWCSATAARCQELSPTALLNAARSGDPSERSEAIDRLGTLRNAPDAVIKTLVVALGDENVDVRWHSARALGEIGPRAKSAAAALRTALADSTPLVRMHAAKALGELRDDSPTTVGALVKLATHEDGRVARAAIKALRNLEVDAAILVDALGDALDADEQAVAMHAVEALVERGEKAVPVLIAALADERAAHWACIAIEEIGPAARAAVPALTRLLEMSKDNQTQTQALLALASIGTDAKAAGGAILKLMKEDQEAALRAAAAYAAGAVGADGADPALEAALASPEPFLSLVAAWSLAKIHPQDSAAVQRAVTRLTDALGSADALMRTAAAKGLQDLNLSPELVAPKLIAMASDPDPSVVANVIDALASLGESVVPRAAKALENPQLRDVALAVLQRLGPTAKGALPAIIAAIDSPDPKFAANVQLVLAEMGPAAAPAAGRLTKSLQNEDARLRHSAMYALGGIGPPAAAAVPGLQQHLEGENDFGRVAAAWALLRIASKNRDVVEQALPHVIVGLTNEDEVVRLELVMALADLGTAAKSAVPALTKLSQEDSSDIVRTVASEALQSIQGAR